MLEKLQNDQNWPFQVNSDHFGKKIFEKLQNSQNWPFQINLDHFSKKILEKLQNGKNRPYQYSCHLKTIRQNNQKSNQDILGINMNIHTKYEVSVTIYVGRKANQRKSTITSAI